MERDPDIDQALFTKFLNNQCSEGERDLVLNWLSDPKNKVRAAQMMENHWAVINVTDGLKEIDGESLLESTRNRIPEFSKSDRTRKPGTFPRSRKTFRAQLLAASVLVVTVFTFGILFLPRENETKMSPVSSEVREVSTSSGQISEVILPDGTKVRLNAQSSIIYSEKFLQFSNREVTLTGEAFFDVTEDPSHPFIVRTTSINIVVLGTSFNLKSYDDDATIETTLIKGKVLIENLSDPGRKVELRPNQKAIFSRATKNISLVDVKRERAVKWSERTLQFENEELGDVLKSLERWYGISVHLEKETNTSCRLTASFDKETLAETLEIFKSLTGIEYSIVGKEVFIKGKICDQ